MAKRKKKESCKRPSGKVLRSLGRKWARSLENQSKDMVKHLTLAQELYELALETDGAELKIVEHFEGRKKPKTKTLKLTDPKAALLQMVRFCNVWVPAGQWVCLLRGCPPWNPPGAPAGKYCFLIGCTINLCPLPGAAKTRCIYLCI